MDLADFNARGKAEDGFLLRLRNPTTGEPLGTDDDYPAFRVRGFAARSAQNRLGKMLLDAQKRDGEKSEDPSEVGFQGAHNAMIDNAMVYIIEAVNIENNGKKVKTDAQIREVLDMTFPKWVTDEAGKTSIVNHPFAKQVSDAAREMDGFLAEPATA